MPGSVLRTKRFCMLVIAAVALGVSSAEAQSTLRGTVQADSSGPRLAGAEITFADLGRVARSDAGGKYLLDKLPAGSYQVVVRALGYRPFAALLELGNADTTEVDFVLSRAAAKLPTVTVEGEVKGFPSGKMADFERRRRLGFGVFLERDQLRRVENQRLSITLRTLLSIQLVPRPWACGGGFAIASGRGSSFGNGQQLYCYSDRGQTFRPACYLSIYVDGARVWAWDSAEPPNVDEVLTASLEGIEVYRGTAQLPTELGTTGNQCGAVVLWTRVGGTL